MIQMAGKTKQNGIQLPLEPLLAMLRRRGFIIKPDDYLEVLQLVRQFGSQNIDETAEWLCPVLATGPQEQALFYTILEEYKNQQSHTAEIKQPKRSWLRRYWWVHVIVLAVLALLFAIPNPKPGLRAKIAPLKSLYEIGDTLILDASEVFLGRDEDTARTNVFWRINNELPVQGYRYRYVIKKAGPIRIIQSLRLGNVDTLNMRDTTYTYACSYIPEISIKTDSPTIRKGSMLHVTSVYSKDENKDARLKWQITGTVDSIIYDTEELFIKTDSAGDLQINCTLIPSADSACANTSVLKVKIIEDTEQFKSEMRMAGTKWESPKPKMKTLLHWLILLPSIAGILLLDFLKRRRKKKPELFAKGNEESIAALKPVYEVPFEKRDTLIVSDETGLKRLFNQMRQKTEDDIQQLNVRETIATITKNGGIPDLVFSPRLKQREYLLLIERTNPKSLSTAFFEWFARTMQEANLSVSIVFYDQDFLCYHKDFPLGITLHRCGQLFGHHILIICGSGYNLLDSAYPVWNKQLAEALNQWDFKGLITPIPFPDWALKEKVISEKLVIVPADLNALDILIPFIREKQTGAYSYLKAREKQWSSLEETDFESTIELKQYLGNDEVLYQWLCAACLYPKIRWEILVEAGNIVCNNHACPEKLTYSNLLKLVRIKWVTEGTYPQRTRLNLLKDLSNENEIAVRQRIISMLNAAEKIYGKGFYFSYEQSAQQITNEFVLYAHDSEKFSIYREGSERFLAEWEKDRITDGPMQRYLGPQEKDVWETPLNTREKGAHAGLKAEALKRAENIRKKGWMEYMQSMFGWGIILYALLITRVLPSDSKLFGWAYNKNPNMPVLLHVALNFNDSCTPAGKPLISLIAGNTDYTMDYTDTTEGVSGNQLIYGTISTNYKALTMPGSFITVAWDKGEIREFDALQPTDSIYISSFCPSYKPDTIPAVSAARDTISRYVIQSLPSSLFEIWISNEGRFALDARTKSFHEQWKTGEGIFTYEFMNTYRVTATRQALIILKDKDGNYQPYFVLPENEENCTLTICEDRYSDTTQILNDSLQCNRSYSFSLLYPRDNQKVYLPMDGRRYVSSETGKIKKSIELFNQNIERIKALEMKQVQRAGSSEGYKLKLQLYVNSFYFRTMGQRQARLRQVRDNWIYRDSRLPFIWEMVAFSGGPFDRDYILITQQYTPPPAEANTEQVPEQQSNRPSNRQPQPPVETEPVSDPVAERILSNIVNIASKEVGVTEDPPGSNSGPRINEYLESINLKPGLPWSTAFVYWVYQKAGAEKKLRKTGSVMQLWNGIRAEERISMKEAMANPELIKPGNIFFIQYPSGGHIGIVESIKGQTIFTIEGNSNNKGNDESLSVIKGVRQINSVTLGFSNFGRKELPARAY